jgi:hypothetical protein
MKQISKLAMALFVVVWCLVAVLIFALGVNLLGENGAVLPVVAYLFITAVIVERGRTFEDI